MVDWAPHPDEGDKVLFIFDGGELGNGDVSLADPEEIEAVKFWNDSDLAEHLPLRLHDRVAMALHVGEGDT